MYCQQFYHHRDFSIEKDHQIQTISPNDSSVTLTNTTTVSSNTNSNLTHHTLSPPPSPFHSSNFNHENYYSKGTINNNFTTKQIQSTSDLVSTIDTNENSNNISRWNQDHDLHFAWPHNAHYVTYNSQICTDLNQNIIVDSTINSNNNNHNNNNSSSINNDDISDADSTDIISFKGHLRGKSMKTLINDVKQQFNGYNNNNNNNNSNNNNNITSYNENIQNKQSLFSLMSQTIEDDEDARRKRRRERNKLAASKCRFKKRQHVAFLISESERLETNNSSLKLTLGEIQNELEQLAQVLHSHKCLFVKQNILQLSNVI